jgi:hypothetical protein
MNKRAYDLKDRKRENETLLKQYSERIQPSPLFFLIPSVVARVSILAGGLFAAETPARWMVVLRGFSSDFAVGYLIGIVAYLFRRTPLVFWIFWIAWSLFEAFNMDHIQINDSNVNYVHAHFVANKQFLLGCIFAPRNLYHWGLIVFCSAAILLAATWTRIVPRMSGLTTSVAAFLCLAAVFMPVSPLAPNWVQMNPVEENLKRFVRGPAKGSDVYALEPAERKVFFDLDLSGSPLFPFPSRTHNVLLLILENLSFDTAFSGQMPYLTGLSRNHISYANFMSLQRQSNRGLYALMCGDYPNLISLEAKADVMLAGGKERIALPSILAANGYRTLFMEANDLGFFQRGMFCKKIGFSKSLGKSDYPAHSCGGGWGVADKVLFAEALKEIKTLHKCGQPWFVTLFTGGTHYPYTVPGVISPTQAQAIAAMDTSLKEFLSGAEKEGLLRNTLVVITSDEATESSGKGIQRELAMHHIPLVVVTPQVSGSQRPAGIFTQRDLLVSICDYLGLKVQSMAGRSIFRSYRDDQTVIFGNVYTSRRYAYMPAKGFASRSPRARLGEPPHLAAEAGLHSAGSLYVYTILGDQWLSYEMPPGGLFRSSMRLSRPDPGDVALLERVFSFNEATFDRLNTQILYRQTGTEYTGPNKLLGGHRMSCKSGDRLRWEVALRADEPLDLTFLATFRHIPLTSESNRRPIFKKVKCVPGEPCVFRYEHLARDELDSVSTSISVVPSGKKAYAVKHLSVERIRGSARGGEQD